MVKISTGSKILDEFMEGGLETGKITTFYGPAASGKTLLCKLCALNIAKEKKVIYIDSGNGFSVKRIKQLSKKEDILDKIFLLKPTSFYNQKEIIEKIEDNENKNLGLVIIDSPTYFYRIEIAKKDYSLINRVLAFQMNSLIRVAKKNNMPIVITSLIYDDLNSKNKIKMLGGEIIKRRSNCIIELQNYNNLKKAIMKKPKEKEILFRITQEGIIHH